MSNVTLIETEPDVQTPPPITCATRYTCESQLEIAPGESYASAWAAAVGAPPGAAWRTDATGQRRCPPCVRDRKPGETLYVASLGDWPAAVLPPGLYLNEPGQPAEPESSGTPRPYISSGGAITAVRPPDPYMTVSTVTASPQALAAAATVNRAADGLRGDETSERDIAIARADALAPIIAAADDECEGAPEQPAPDATAVIDLRDAHTEAIQAVTEDGGGAA